MNNRAALSNRDRTSALADIRGNDRVAKVEAAKKLSTDSSTYSDLRRLLRHENREDTRHAIAFALSWQDDLRSWSILVRLLSDRSESPMVRGQAAEGLAYKFHRKRKGSLGFQSAIRALVAALSDPSPEVRYFSVFALGASGDRRMLPVLRRMKRDRARLVGFGAVSDEAKEAIKRIQMQASR